MAKRVWLYGFDDLHKVVNRKNIKEERANTWTVKRTAEYMTGETPNVRCVIAIADRPGLREDFMETRVQPHFVKDYEFFDMLNRDGITILVQL